MRFNEHSDVAPSRGRKFLRDPLRVYCDIRLFCGAHRSVAVRGEYTQFVIYFLCNYEHDPRYIDRCRHAVSVRVRGSHDQRPERSLERE